MLVSPRTITPSFDCTAEVTVQFQGETTGHWDAGQGRFACIAIRADETIDDGYELYIPADINLGIRQSYMVASSTRAGYTMVGRFALTANVQYRLGLLLHGSNPGPGLNYFARCFAAVTSVTLIKR
jgi:hypothetical protein